MFYVYVLLNPQQRIYIGQTDNLNRRIAEHNSSEHNCHKFTTKFPGPWQIIHHEQFSTRSEAMAREKWLKETTGLRWINKHIGTSGSVSFAAGLTVMS
jgi:putative endonuclease